MVLSEGKRRAENSNEASNEGEGNELREQVEQNGKGRRDYSGLKEGRRE